MVSDESTHWQSEPTIRDASNPTQYPAELLNLPWIDVHNHAQTLSWTDREEFALTGCELMVMIAYGYHWAPYKPVDPHHVRYQWDDALSRLSPITDTHPFSAKLGIGVHTGARVEDPGTLLEALPAYCERDEVVAIGETGITPQQHGAKWGVAGQKDIVRGQMTIAAEYGLAVILHTPSPEERSPPPFSWYETDTTLLQDPVISGESQVMDSITLDLSLCEQSDLAESQLVFSHAHPSFASFILDNTDCFVSYTLNYPRMYNTGLEDIIAMLEAFGPDRILIETDCAGVLRSDPSVIKRSIFELYRAGISLEDIRQVVYENQRGLLAV